MSLLIQGSWKNLKSWLYEFKDDRVRAQEVKTLYAENAITLFTHLIASVIFVYVYDFVRSNPWICVTLFIWCCLAAWSYYNERLVLKLMPEQLEVAEISWKFLLINVRASIAQTICLSILLLFFLRNDPQGFNSPAVLGILFYYFASIIKDFSVRLLSVAYTSLLLPPLAIFFLWQGTVASYILAVFLIIFIWGASSFSINMASVVVAQIEQRFALQALTEKLAIERDRADAANEAKSRFFTAASHDARQPLQAIALLSDSLVRSPHLNQDDRRLVDRISSNLHSIRNLFNRVLDISRIESGSIEVARQVFPLQQIFDRLDAQFGERAAAKGLWIRILRTDVNIEHDAQLLERMLANLIDNAIKFTGKGGVWVAYRSERMRIEVRDSGIGMNALDQAKVFEEFYQAGNQARSREDGAGLGLGLSIVQRLSHLTQTPIGLRSAPERGSVFWLNIAASDFALKSDKFVPTESQKFKVAVKSNSAERFLQGMNLVLVDDDAELRNLLTERLQEFGAAVTQCENLAQVAQWSGEQPAKKIDLLLTDFRLGEGGTGLDVIHLMRQHFGARLPVIVITGDTAAKGMQDLKNLPQVQLIYKPVEIPELVALCAKSAR